MLNAATRSAASYAVARRTTLGILLRDAAVSTPTLHFSFLSFLFFYIFGLEKWDFGKIVRFVTNPLASYVSFF